MTQNITTYSIYSRANGELKYSLLGARRLKPIRAQKDVPLCIERVEKIFANVKLTALKGGDWPAGKLIVLKLMRSKSEDILWKGPYVFPLESVNRIDLIRWSSSSST